MKNKYGLIIFILIILLILSEAYLFFAKDSVVAFFNTQEDLASLTKPIKISVNAIDDSIIKSDHFKSLKNNVNNFEYDKICERPTNPVKAVVITDVATSSNGVESTSTPTATENINCRQGNNNPFSIIKKK
ncbi:MAG: hypothetical protein ACYC40_00500 [Patescibacteria group bacterium]